MYIKLLTFKLSSTFLSIFSESKYSDSSLCSRSYLSVIIRLISRYLGTLLNDIEGGEPKRGRRVYIIRINNLHQVKKGVEDFQECNGEAQLG
jgi:hypothetical protein